MISLKYLVKTCITYSYPGTDIVMVVFNLADPESLKNVESKWIPEIQKNVSNKPIILGKT